MPCTPERVWKAIHAQDGAESGGGATEGAADAALRRGRTPADRSRTGADAVIPAQFDYLAPTTVEEALAALAEHGDDAKIIAGGQSLLPVLRMRLNAPEVVIDLGKIEALRGVRDDGDAIVIGAMTTHADVGSRPAGRASTRSLITKAVEHLADAAGPAPRHLRRRARARRPGRRPRGAGAGARRAVRDRRARAATRTVAADDFFVDLFETAIGEDEILTEVRIPKHTGWGAHYEKFVRVAHQWPIVAVAAAVRVEGGTISRGPGRADQHGLDAAAGPRPSRRRWSGSRPPTRPSAPRPRGPPRAPTRPRTSTATPTTAGTSPPC